MGGHSEYDSISESIRGLLCKVVGSSDACTIALSGGLDSSIIAALRAGDHSTRCVSIVSSDFGASDMVYSQTIARKADLPLEIINVSIEDILDAARQTIKILGNFNTIEIRNSIVVYLALCAARDAGAKLVLTGDGADELFAGYSFLVNAPLAELRPRLERLQRIMHFPSVQLAKSIGINVRLPYLDQTIIDFSRKISEDLLVNNDGKKKVGKWILRKTFEDDVSHKIAWRQKVPMSQGAGLDGLGGFLDRTMLDSVFAERKAKILERDGVQIRSKESLHYYEVYREHYDVPQRAPDGAPGCPDCHSDLSANDGRFCRMCGKFPI